MLNGKRVKGFSQDFFPNKDRFHVYPAAKPSGEATEVLVKELKAVSWFKILPGIPYTMSVKSILEGDKPSGRKVEVTFMDGEVLVGTTLGYDPEWPGFFLFPVDPKSNNIRVFAISTSVKKVRYL